jgi:DNA-binding HxlR family transcriptional regulator
MKTYGQYCPVAQALEVVGDRWTILVIRELMNGSTRFGEILNGVPRMPRSMLAARLQHLERSGLVTRKSDGENVVYQPTDAALALSDVVLGLGFWARRWAHRQPQDHELDPVLLLWDMQRRLDKNHVPEELVVVRFDFADDKRGFRHYWLKIENRRGEVCINHPGHPETLIVQSSTRTMVEIWMGHTEFGTAIADRRVTIEGPPAHARSFPSWFSLHLFVELERKAASA